jgi:hypothetical protein
MTEPLSEEFVVSVHFLPCRSDNLLSGSLSFFELRHLPRVASIDLCVVVGDLSCEPNAIVLIASLILGGLDALVEHLAVDGSLLVTS